MTATTQRPPWTEWRLVTPLLRLLAGRLGLDIDGIRVLEVRGRHSGTWHHTPLKVLTHAGQRYLVSLHGNSDWVRNLRVHPHARLRLGRHLQHVTATELPDELRAPVLDAYLAATRRRTTRQLLTGTDTRAQDHPIFQLRSTDEPQPLERSPHMPSQQLLQPQPTSIPAPDQQRLRPAGWLLVAGALVSLAAGATPSMYDLYTSQTPQHFLQLLADRNDTWVAVHLAFLCGVVLTTLGLAALTRALADSRGKTLATIGLTLFLVATPIRVLQTIFAATVTVTAADQAAHSGVVPPAYQLLEGFLWGQPNWTLAAFIALTGLGLASYGAALLEARWLARWLGWTFVASGLLLAATVIVVGDGPPEAIALPLLLGGILALRQPRP